MRSGVTPACGTSEAVFALKVQHEERLIKDEDRGSYSAVQIKVGVEIGGVEIEMLDALLDNFDIYSVVLAGTAALDDDEPTDASLEGETRLSIELPDEVEMMEGRL